MNCKNCNSPLEPQTRFCPRCGTPATGNPIISGVDQTIQATPRPIEAESTLITPQESMQPATNFQPFSQEIEKTQQAQWPQQAPWSQPDSNLQPEWPLPQSQQASSYAPPNPAFPLALTEPLATSNDVPQHVPLVSNGIPQPVPSIAPTATNAQKGKSRARRSPGGCVLRLITALVLLLILLVGAWIFALRPYVHGITENDLNNAMTQTVNQIPPIASVILPPHTPLPPITETGLQNLIRLNIAPADPVQNPVVHITQQGVRLEFTVHENFLSTDFNFPSAVSFLPALDEQGNLVARNVSVEGIASLVMSSDEMTSLLNQHFSDAMKRLGRTISSVTLEQGQIDITLN